jgi:hypothetical protein
MLAAVGNEFAFFAGVGFFFATVYVVLAFDRCHLVT